MYVDAPPGIVYIAQPAIGARANHASMRSAPLDAAPRHIASDRRRMGIIAKPTPRPLPLRALIEPAGPLLEIPIPLAVGAGPRGRPRPIRRRAINRRTIGRRTVGARTIRRGAIELRTIRGRPARAWAIGRRAIVRPLHGSASVVARRPGRRGRGPRRRSGPCRRGGPCLSWRRFLIVVVGGARRAGRSQQHGQNRGRENTPHGPLKKSLVHRIPFLLAGARSPMRKLATPRC